MEIDWEYVILHSITILFLMFSVAIAMVISGILTAGIYYVGYPFSVLYVFGVNITLVLYAVNGLLDLVIRKLEEE